MAAKNFHFSLCDVMDFIYRSLNNLGVCVVEMLSGWWRVADMEELRSLVKALHSRGIREKALQKQIQKHMEYIAQACAKNRDGEWIPLSSRSPRQA